MPALDLNRLYSVIIARLLTRQDRNQPLELSTELQAVLDVNELLTDPRVIVQSALDLSPGGSIFVSAGTVPAGKRWSVKAGWRQVCTGSSQLAVQVVYEGTTNFGLLSVSATGEQAVPGLDIILNPGDQVGALASGNAADTARGVRYIVHEIAFR